MTEPTRTPANHSTLTVSSAYQACLDQAQQQSVVMAKRWYTVLAEKLLDKSTTSLKSSDKHQTHEAWAALTAQQAAIERGFPVALAQALVQGNSVGAAHQPARSMSSLRFGDLELMGDAQVQETLDEARLQQIFLLASDAGFAGFAARLSTAQGYATVQIDKNPLRPDVFANALIHTLQGVPVAPDVRARWLVYGGQIMGEQLQLLYVDLQNLLEKQGIDPAAYKVKSAPGEPGRANTPQHAPPSGGRSSGGGAGGGSGAGGTGNPGQQAQGQPMPSGNNVYLSREELLTLDHLHRLMSGEYDDAFSSATGAASEQTDRPDEAFVAAPALNKTASPSMSAALGALAELEKSGAGNKGRKTARPMPPVPVALMREKLKADSRSLGQSLAIEVVGLMIEQLTSDARLLPPVQQMIANAEPAFLRMGMSEPRFFSDKNHPARRLLEAITAKSLAYNHEDAPGFADFMGDLQKVAGSLTCEEASNAHPNERHFETLLQDFEARHAKRNEAAALVQKQAVQALLQAEQRNLLAEKIALEVSQRSDFTPGNRIITAFVTGPWAQAMAKERLLGEHGGLGSNKAVYSLALGDMLWSIDFAQASRYRKRLVKIIPDLLNVLRGGLLSIDYPLAQSKEFFNELMRLHELALTATSAPVSAPINKREDLENAFADGDAGIKMQPWLDPTEAQQSGFMDFMDEEPKPRYEATVPQSLPGEVDAPTAGVEPAFDSAEVMQPGAWVELVANDQWVRAQLTWISPHNTLFMFTSAGGRSHSMTVRMLEQLTAQGRFKVISRRGVLDGAFDNVAQTAMRNSVQEKPKP